MLNRTSFANVKIFLSPTSVIKHLLAPFLPHEKKNLQTTEIRCNFAAGNIIVIMLSVR